jgi:putative acetyltransferase
MDPALVIRREQPDDLGVTRELHDAAFGVPAGEEHSLQTCILDALRADGDVLPDLTFVAALRGEVVGHVVCSALVAAVLVTADQQHEPSVVLLGDPGWYAHFGFEPAAAHAVASPRPWPDGHFQLKRLQAWRPGLAGPFRYAAAFDLEP